MKKINMGYEILNVLYPFLVLYVFFVIALWFFNKEEFWKHLIISLSVIIVLTLLIILFKKLSKKRRNDLINNIKTLGLHNDIDNFINRSGKEKGKNVWKYMDCSFDIDKMKVFIKILKEKGLKIKNLNDLEYILTYFINDKEETLIKGGFSFNNYNFSSLSGIEFENLLVRLFKSINYIVEHPGGVGDQGGDLILNKNGKRILIQAKCYNNVNIGNKAVQEAVAAKQYYDCGRVVVVGTSDFTREAIDLAKVNNVELIGKKQLQELLLHYLNENWI
jgi:hypothetical protein